MRRLITVFSLILICISSCQKGPYLSISGEKSHSFSAQGGTYSISFSSNRDWYVTISEPWCTVSPTSGAARDGEIIIVVTCEPNTGYDARTCTLSVNNEGAKESITIEQAAAEGLILSQSLYELTNAAQYIEVTIQANVDYTVTIDSQSEKWITRNSTRALSSNKLTFNVFENTEFNDRTGHITIAQKDGNLKGEITIHQAQKDGLFVNTQDYVVSEDSQSLSIEVNANIQYEVLSEVEWISYVETKALIKSSVILNVEDNESSFSRSGKVTIRQTEGALSSVINVTQQARPDLKTENATEISFFGCKLNGRLAVESMSDITSEVWFLYSSTASSLEGLKSDGVKVLSSLTDNGSFDKDLSGLSLATKYSYVACAKVNGREYYGEVISFITSDFSAEVTTKNATGIDYFEAKLNGSLSTSNAEGFAKDVWFLYSSSSSSLEQLVAEGIKVPSSLTEAGDFSASLTDLNYGTEYFYVACAKVHDRSFYGEVKSFTTSSFSANVKTVSASSDHLYKATVNGSVVFENTGGFSKNAGFLYGEKETMPTLEILKEAGESANAAIDLDNCFTAKLSGLKCGVTYNYVAWVKVHDKVFYGDICSFTSCPLPDGAVDMGLSVGWASCNIGATSPEDFGDLYAWGETETKEEYGWATYKWGSPSHLTKYNSDRTVGVVDNKTFLDPEDDVAHVKLDKNWRMPTRDEVKELIDNCTWTWVIYNGIRGYTVTSNINGNKIFLPTIDRNNTDNWNAGYWTSSHHQRELAYILWINGVRFTPNYSENRGEGLPVRPVTE